MSEYKIFVETILYPQQQQKLQCLSKKNFVVTKMYGEATVNMKMSIIIKVSITCTCIKYCYIKCTMS